MAKELFSKQPLSVLIPCFNEEATIDELLSRVLKQNMVGEVIIVDDCSTDSSAKKILSLKDSRIRYFYNENNLGKGKSISRAMSLAQREIMIIQDADLEYAPEEYPRLLKPILDGRADVVYGSRFLSYESRRAIYYWHRLGNQFLTTLSNILTNLDLTDMETCYKVFRSEYAKKLDIRENRFGMEPEITAKFAAMRLRIYEVPISYSGRTYEEGKKITWRDGFRAIYCMFKYNSPLFKRRFKRGL
jgi:glycosyltransferase involved in cell wall biosynthesis